VRVFLAGEGKAELGHWFRHPSYREEESQPGLLEALLRRVKKDGWSVGDGICWKNIPKYRAAHSRQPPEIANVLGLIMRARDAGCDVVAFSRDRDRDRQREHDVHAGIAHARDSIPDCPAIIGGMAVEAIESWVASMRGCRNAEGAADPCQLLDQPGLAAMRAIAECADLSNLPADAQSLRTWLDTSAQVLGAGTEVSS
jgi:hypothetical protein